MGKQKRIKSRKKVEEKRQITCFVRKSDNPRFPYALETYPMDGEIQRRDFDCLSKDEAIRIAWALYGSSARMSFDGE